MRNALPTIVFLLASLAPASSQEHPKLSPFSALRWRESVPEVELEGIWYEPLAIDGVAVTEILAFARKTHGGRWQKRFGEDLVQLLVEMKRAPGSAVDLELKHLDTGEIEKRERVPMTAANRRAIRDAAAGAPASTPSRIPRAQAEEDLRELAARIESAYSYAKLRGFDYRAELARLAGTLADDVDRGQLGLEIERVLAQFGDGHSGVAEELFEGPYAPFLVEPARGGLVAFRADRSGLLSAEHPYLTAIDDLEVAAWMAAAAAYVPRGSAALVERQCARTLRLLARLRGDLGRPARSSVVVRLAASGAGGTTELELPLSRSKPIFGPWPRKPSGLLEDGIGYLRLESMEDDPEFLERLAADMERFRGTRGLVIDVRGNGGGSRAALRALFPYFMKKGDRPRVANVAAYRLRPGDDPHRPEGYLENRWLYPERAKAWSAAERAAIRKFAAGFEPEWKLPAGEFSDWHYFVLSPRSDEPIYPYDRPVVVLVDSGCFSATDIFLAACKGWRNVTLLGTPSGGGSGRAEVLPLAHSRLPIRLSTMASFRPDGTLYDGSGIEPDVRVEPLPTDLVGATDSVLEAALARF